VGVGAGTPKKAAGGAAIAWLLALAACGQLAQGARQQFIAEYSCPSERVTLAELKGVQPSQLFAADWRAGTPPDEVRADPGRLAQWRAEEDERRKGWEAWINSSRLFRLSGCGHAAILACRPPGRQSSPGVTAICNEPPDAKG
jgi:hypothetical protein